MVCVGERPKASLLGKGCMSCTCGRSGYGRCEAKDSVAGKREQHLEERLRERESGHKGSRVFHKLS